MGGKYEETFEKIFSFWDKLNTSEKEQLCNNSSLVKYKKGENVHNGSQCTGAIVVKSGCLRTYIISEDGREVTLYRLYKGDICMLSASCVLQSITFDVAIDAEEDSECYVIGGQIFSEVSNGNVYVKNFALEIAVSRFSEVVWVMRQILFMSLDRRLAVFLWDEINKNESDTVMLTHEQIAKYISSARETVSRMFKYFSSEGIVQNFRGGVKVINRPKLRSLAFQHSENI